MQHILKNKHRYDHVNFDNKKIGIWGFGLVGASVLRFLDQFDLAHLEILHNKIIQLPQTRNTSFTTLQDSGAIDAFFMNNDYVIVSPGIPLHNYQAYQHKCISELDLFYAYNQIPTIAITGSLGKTSITHLLTNILQHQTINALAAGNIGYPMLNTLTPHHTNTITSLIVLELSSFQLQQAKFFAPDIAIITNIYDNHLDHHKSMDEYTQAKCNIFTQQHPYQQALVPFELASQLSQKYPNVHNFVFFCPTKPAQDNIQLRANQALYYLDHTMIYKVCNNVTSVIFDISNILPITFTTNLLIMIATLDIKKTLPESLSHILNSLNLPDHRLQKIASKHGSNFYNDSKSTVWQATLQAVQAMNDNKPIKLFLGGLSKGANRKPLLQALADKKIYIYTFGKEAEQLGAMCKELNIPYACHETLKDSFDACILSINEPSNILFSPAGSSYDLFENYIDRGNNFAQLVENYITQ